MPLSVDNKEKGSMDKPGGHLSAENVSVAFAGLKALSSVTLDIKPGVACRDFLQI